MSSPPPLPYKRPKRDLAFPVGTLAPELDQEHQLLILSLRQSVLPNVLAVNFFLREKTLICLKMTTLLCAGSLRKYSITVITIPSVPSTFTRQQQFLALYCGCGIFKYLLNAVQANEPERALHFDAEPVLEAAEPLLDVGVVVHPYDLGVVHLVVECGVAGVRICKAVQCSMNALIARWSEAFLHPLDS